MTGLVGIAVGMALFGTASYLPTQLRMVGGISATESGLLMVPMMAGIVGASVVCGQLIAHTGHYRTYPVLGSALTTLGVWLLSRMETDTPRLQFGIWTAVLGAGIGMVMPVLILAVQNSVRPADIGAATAAGELPPPDRRQRGRGSVRRAPHGPARRPPSRARGRRPPRPGLPHPGPRPHPARPLRDAYVEAYAEAVPRIFLYLTPVLVLGLLIACFLKERTPVSFDEVPVEPEPERQPVPVAAPSVRVPQSLPHPSGGGTPSRFARRTPPASPSAARSSTPTAPSCPGPRSPSSTAPAARPGEVAVTRTGGTRCPPPGRGRTC